MSNMWRKFLNAMTNRPSAFNLLQHVLAKESMSMETYKQHGIKRHHRGLPENIIYC